jgi:hypothetical protein
VRPLFGGPGEVLDAHTDHVRHRGIDPYRKQGPLKRVAPVANGPAGRVEDESAPAHRRIVGLGGVMGCHARLQEPIAVSEFHEIMGGGRDRTEPTRAADL